MYKPQGDQPAPASHWVKSLHMNLKTFGVNFTQRKQEASTVNTVWGLPDYASLPLSGHVSDTKHVKNFSFGDSQSVFKSDWYN